MVSQKAKGYILLAVLLVFVFFGILRGYPFSGECEPYGSVTYKGWTAPDGYKVVALIDNQKFDSCLVENGGYKLTIPSDDPQTADKKEGWADGDIINFRVNGQAAVPSIAAVSTSKEVNITVLSLGTELTTWGKIKALFR